MKLIIAEKPELGKAIAEALSKRDNEEIETINGGLEVGEYTVTWVFGHMLKLKEIEDYDINLKIWRLEDLPIYFENWEHVEDKQEYKQSRLKQIKYFLSKATEVINAGDPDDEGQYLIDEILEYYKYKGKTLRVLINDNNAEYIIKVFSKLEDNKKYESIGKSAYARAISDNIFGKNLSRFFSLKAGYGHKIIIGRVQTPTLGLVIERDLEIENHKKIFYYNFEVDNGKDIKLTFNPKEKLEDESLANEIKKEIENKFNKFNVSVKKEIIKEAAPLPFNLAELQSEANKKYGYSPQEILEITQALREKYKAITYNRSDCQYLGEENFTEASEIIEIVKKKLNLSTNCINSQIKSKAFDNTKITAHHGIIPTKSNFDISKLSEKEKKIYDMIAIRYLMQFTEPSEYLQTKLESEEYKTNLIDELIKFTTSNKKLVKLGYKELEGIEVDENKKIDNIENDFIFELATLDLKKNESKPKPRYTLGTLLKDMTAVAKYVKDEKIKNLMKEKDKDKKGENGSIGTPATRASIIDSLINSGYIEVQGKNIISTEKAREFYSKLPYEAKSIDNTALWWTIQEDIKENKKEVKDLTLEVLNNIKNIINQSKDFKMKEIEKKELLPGEVVEINSKNGVFYKGIFEKESRILAKKYKYFDQEINITKKQAENLFNSKSIEVKLKSKDGKEYKAKFKLVLNGKWLNLAKEK